jgi:HK97 family phage portal protein
MVPWLKRWEQAIKRDLFLPSERSVYFPEFNVDGLLRGDIKSRYEAYAVGRQNGWLSADDIRELENMNPLPDGQGKVYLTPLNMVPVTSTQ